MINFLMYDPIIPVLSAAFIAVCVILYIIGNILMWRNFNKKDK